MRIWQPETNLTTELHAWWTDEDAECDFCLAFDVNGSRSASLALSYLEAKQLYRTLREKFDAPKGSPCQPACDVTPHTKHSSALYAVA